MALPLDQVKVVDADTHFTEPHDLWTSRAPAAWKDRVPHVTPVDGEATWVVDGEVLGRAGAGGVIDRDGVKGRSFEGLYEWEIDQAHPGAYDPVARLQLLDEVGIFAQIIFPGVVGLGGQKLAEVVEGRRLRTLCTEIFNDFNAELQSGSGNRLLPMAILPVWDIEASVREARRAHSLGLRGVNMTSDTQDLGTPDLASRQWDPLWEACCELESPGPLPHRRQPHHDELLRHLPVAVPRRRHQAGHRGDPPLHRQRPGGRQHHLLGNARAVPRAQGRLGGERRRMDPVHPGGTRLRDGRERPDGPGRPPSTPTEYFRRQIYATTWFERTNLPAVVAAVGEDNIMFETDFPHPTCLYPDPLKTAAETMRELSTTAQRKILGENAAKLYRL